MEKDPIINCHSHIFTGKHVPPFLAKTIIPKPFYRLLNLGLVFRLFHWWYAKGPGRWHVMPWYKRIVRIMYTVKMFLARHFIWGLLAMLTGLFLTVQVLFILWDLVSRFGAPSPSGIAKYVLNAREWLLAHHLLLPLHNTVLSILLVVLLLVFFQSGRSLIFFIFKRAWKFMGALPGKETKEMFNRYLSIGRFTFQKGQGTVLGELERQYPDGSGFVILPMDMEFMEAGTVKEKYRDQMEALAKLKKDKGHNIYPFVFADPRRMAAEPDYFKYTTENGKITLEDCFIKTYIEEKKFSGFKIYPALGYFPFDEMLLPLWKYAADNRIPIITHCVRGPMYYRGVKKKEWDYHPIFKQAMGNDLYEPLLLPETKNSTFTVNFTHPLNFLCLLEEPLLRHWIHTLMERKPDSPLKQIFGFTDTDTPLGHTLNNLKICFGHFGGGDEWNHFFEKDRYGHSNQFSQRPDTGIDFLHTSKGEPSPGKPEQLWKHTDWYSLICSMMLQHPNVYADISYILHNDAEILPLLKQTLLNPGLRPKVLYGTDFYVVRNHKSDKNMLADMMGGLPENDFDAIARENPKHFLNILSNPVQKDLNGGAKK
jgi:predicted TIM-barrel fold metal-dependent hydrolase